MHEPRRKNVIGIALLLIAVFVTPPVALAQKLSEKDSLLHVYASQSPRDTSFVKLLNSLSRVYRMIDPDSALRFSQEAYTLSADQAYTKGVATSLNFTGVAYFYKGEYPTAQAYQRKALAYSEKNHLTLQISNALNSLALAYHYQGNYLSALDAYLKALQFEEQTKNLYGRVKVLANIGLLWKAQGDFEKAIMYGKQAIALSDSLPDPRALKANMFNNLGIAYIELKNYKEGLGFIEQSLRLHQALGNKTHVTSCLMNIGFCYLRMGDLALAERYTTEALHKSEKAEPIRDRTLTLINLAAIYTQQHKTAEALPPSLEALALAQKANDKGNILLSYQTLADVYTHRGAHALANSYLTRALSLSDSLKNADITKKLRDIQKSFELNKKESEIALLAKDAELKNTALVQEKNLRIGLIVLIAGLLIFAAIAYYGFALKASLSKKLLHQNEEIRTQKELIEQINEDLRAQALRAQMNPHFIFNALNSIQFLIFKNNNDSAYHYLAQFSKLLRTVLDNSQENLVSMASEADTLGLYLELESLRFEGGFTYELQSTMTREQMEQVKLMPMVIQPFVENAIVHGLLQKKTDRRLTIQFRMDDANLICEVTDNGIGRKASQEINRRKHTLHHSKGMLFTNERIRVSNAMTKKNSQIEVLDLVDAQNEPAGTRIKITFQC